MPLTLSTRHLGSVYVIHCAGSIIHSDEERALEAALDHGERQFSRLVLNLGDITRLDSMGLGLLVRHVARVAKRGGAIHLAASPSFVTNLLDLTRLSLMMPNFDSEEEAILSFLGRTSPETSVQETGARVLVFDPSPDLCSFARTVLTQHGFNVRTTCSFGDAKLLLRVDHADFILVGPCNSQLSPELAAGQLAELAPRVSVVQLGADFKSHDAVRATELLLETFGISDSQIPH